MALGFGRARPCPPSSGDGQAVDVLVRREDALAAFDGAIKNEPNARRFRVGSRSSPVSRSQERMPILSVRVRRGETWQR